VKEIMFERRADWCVGSGLNWEKTYRSAVS
jgi:hypothetical protein